MTFTEEDALDDGTFKREVKGQLSQRAATKGELYDYYVDALSEIGIETGSDLADFAARVLNDEAFAQKLMDTEVDLQKVKINEIRTEDLRHVKELYDMFGEDESESFDVGELVKKRLNRKLGSPVDTLTEKKGGSRKMRKLERKNRELEEKIEMLQNRISGNEPSPSPSFGGGSTEDDIDDSEEDIDDLFEGLDEDEDTEERVPDDGGDEGSSGDTTEDDDGEDEEDGGGEEGVDEEETTLLLDDGTDGSEWEDDEWGEDEWDEEEDEEDGTPLTSSEGNDE